MARRTIEMESRAILSVRCLGAPPPLHCLKMHERLMTSLDSPLVLTRSPPAKNCHEYQLLFLQSGLRYSGESRASRSCSTEQFEPRLSFNFPRQSPAAVPPCIFAGESYHCSGESRRSLVGQGCQRARSYIWELLGGCNPRFEPRLSFNFPGQFLPPKPPPKSVAIPAIGRSLQPGIEGKEELPD
jgi:hypothetical protein